MTSGKVSIQSDQAAGWGRRGGPPWWGVEEEAPERGGRRPGRPGRPARSAGPAGPGGWVQDRGSEKGPFGSGNVYPTSTQRLPPESPLSPCSSYFFFSSRLKGHRERGLLMTTGRGVCETCKQQHRYKRLGTCFGRPPAAIFKRPWSSRCLSMTNTGAQGGRRLPVIAAGSWARARWVRDGCDPAARS